MIKIKLALVDSDEVYLKRITKLFSSKFQNQIDIYSFSDGLTVADAVREKKINVLIATQDIEINTDKLADFCMFAYFTDSISIASYNNKKSICKYQRADLIYKQILGLYSEKLADKVRYKNITGKKSEISLFMSGCDGAGSTTAAAAYSTYLAAKGKKTLFLNLKQFSDMNSIFRASGEGSFTDAIFAIKSHKVNMTLKLESIVKQSREGVYFYDTCRNALDYTEIKVDELRILLDEMSSSFGYDNIVIVTDFYLSGILLLLLEYSSNIVVVSDTNKISQIQLGKKCEAIRSLEKRKRINISDKMMLILNKSSNKGMIKTEIPVIGIQPKLKSADAGEIVKEISKSGMFDKICVH